MLSQGYTVTVEEVYKGRKVDVIKARAGSKAPKRRKEAKGDRRDSGYILICDSAVFESCVGGSSCPFMAFRWDCKSPVHNEAAKNKPC